MRRRSVAALLCCACVVVALAGCADADNPAEAPPSSSTGSKQWRQGETVEVDSFVADLLAQMRKAGGAKVSTNVAGVRGSGEVQFRSDVADVRMSMTADGAPLEVIVVGDSVFVHGLPDQRTPWVSIDPKATDAVSQTFAAMASPSARNPVASVQGLNGATARVASVDDAGGTTTVEVAFDPQRAQGASPSASSAPSEAVTMAYVMDRRGLPRSVTVNSLGSTIVTTYSDWGAKVAITQPDKKELSPLVIPRS